MNNEDEAKLLEMWDERQVEKTMYRYARALDTGDWTTLRSCFADMINLEYSGMTGFPEVRISADLQVESLKQMQSSVLRMHYYSNLVAELDKADRNKASAFFYYVGRVHGETSPPGLGDPNFRNFSMYDVSFMRTSGDWKISKIKQYFQWIEGNYHLVASLQKSISHLWDQIYSEEAKLAAEEFYKQQA